MKKERLSFRERKQKKAELIKQLIEEFRQPMNIPGTKQRFQHTDEDAEEYLKELRKLKLKELILITGHKDLKPTYNFVDKIRKIKKRKAIIITIYHKNRTSTDYVISKHNRFIKVNEFKYLMPPDMGTWDNKHKMYRYAYFEDNPFPMMFLDDKPKTCPDAEIMEASLHFEFAQKMAKVTEMTKKMDITLVFVILTFVCVAADLIITLKTSGMI